MSWNSWTSLIPTLLIVSACLAWWFTEPKNARINLIAAVGVVLFCWAVAPDLSRDFSSSLYASCVKTVASLHLDVFVVRHANMLLTGAAVVWLVRRAWQTLWKPVPELINILGVDVPDPPDVSLAGIRADAATVNWSRPPPNRSVQKFLIQVNGVVVGDVAANQEPAIVVSGLKPNHFYNVRVIAVGSNNFQAGSRVIRLRTFGRDGRPELGNARLPSNFIAEETYGSGQADYTDENAASRSSFPLLETTAQEGLASPGRDGGSGAGSGPRRNTVTRRHSPSTTSIDQAPIRDEINANAKKTLPELTDRFESIRKEIEETTAMIAKEDTDFRRLLEELEAEKREKKKEQKKKEEQTEKLKRDVNSTDRTMRNALQRKTQREKTLKEKQNERSKFHDNIVKWERSMQDMQREQENFDQQTRELTEERDQKSKRVREENDDLQTECSRLETELKERREEVKELEEARKKLPGGEEDAEWREREIDLKRAWQQRHRELQESLVFENKNSRKLDEQLRILSMQVQHIPQATGYNLYSQANTSGLDFENPALNQLKRRSRNSNSLSSVTMSSPLPAYSQVDPALSAPTGFASSRAVNAPPGFAPGPFMMGFSGDMPARMDEAAIRASSAPLSPSATALLPSNILDDLTDDDEHQHSPSERVGPDAFLSYHESSPGNDPHSPASSGRSPSVLSSPQASSLHLPFPPFQNEVSDRRSFHGSATMPPPITTEASTNNKIGSFFSFQRSRTAKDMEKEAPLLGSLKQGQSQSFPRQTDEAEELANKRRISLSGTWSMFNRNSAGPDILEGHATHSRMFSTRSFNPFSSSSRAGGGIYMERDTSSPRPSSIASSEFPRPSTDSGSIWGPPSDGATLGKPSRLWSPDAPWSRNPSRRPSLHGSPSALKTTLASAEDEILDEDNMPNVHQVGVIGSRPPVPSNKSLKNLNPNAPAFIGSLFKSRPDREKEREGAKEKSKTKDKSKDKAKEGKDKSRSKEGPYSTTDTPRLPSFDIESASESRMSRDGASLHTQTSVSESRDSLSLDMSFSNTPSEPASGGLASSGKDDNVVRKLFRKSSSSKFSLPGRLGGKESSLFKKGPSSTASTNERSSIGDFEDIADEASNASFMGRSYESVTSSPGIGPTSSGAKGKDNKAPVRWLSTFSKKGKKEKESLDLDRSLMVDSEGGGEDGARS
ncbi:hypothetical protein B0T19DRAFT_395909 [Cercophora scortea]|uniref:Fibronectin type-III domain-containing protein n=1 Tax=Cercophora scortea TaxID=314031 RepID=A0AAE0J3B4_9PEZI|nr:hypothetical protein B0T19DRAFT_395909 [Cercophora scortea]